MAQASKKLLNPRTLLQPSAQIIKTESNDLDKATDEVSASHPQELPDEHGSRYWQKRTGFHLSRRKASPDGIDDFPLFPAPWATMATGMDALTNRPIITPDVDSASLTAGNAGIPGKIIDDNESTNTFWAQFTNIFRYLWTLHEEPGNMPEDDDGDAQCAGNEGKPLKKSSTFLSSIQHALFSAAQLPTQTHQHERGDIQEENNDTSSTNRTGSPPPQPPRYAYQWVVPYVSLGIVSGLATSMAFWWPRVMKEEYKGACFESPVHHILSSVTASRGGR